MDNRFQMQFLGGDKRKSLGQIKPHLVAEHRQGARTGAVGLACALIQDAAQKIMIGKHGNPILPRLTAQYASLFRQAKARWLIYPDQAFHRTQSMPILGPSSQDDYGDKRTSK